MGFKTSGSSDKDAAWAYMQVRSKLGLGMEVAGVCRFVVSRKGESYPDYYGGSGKLSGSLFVSNLALFGGPFGQVGELVQRGGTEGI